MAEKEAQEGNSQSRREAMEEIMANIQAKEEEPVDGAEDKESPAPETDSEEAPTDGAPENDAEAEQASEDELKIEEHLPDQFKEAVRGLDKEIAELVLGQVKEAERGANEKFQEAAEARRFFEELNPVFEPYKQTMQMNGLTPAMMVQRFVAAQQILDQNPINGIAQIAQSYGLSGQDLLAKLQEQFGTTEDYVDPQVKTLNDKIARLEGTLNQNQLSAQQAQSSQAMAQIDAFKDAKQDGELKHPHFEKVKLSMGHLMSADPSLDLAGAYDKAIRLDDELYKGTLEREKQSVIKAREEQRKKDVADSKAASRNAKTTKKPATSEGHPENRREHLLQVYNNLNRKQERI